MRQQIAFCQFNPNKADLYGLLLKPLNDARFPWTYKAVPYAAKPRAGDGPYYLKSIIDHIKYLVTKMEADQPITCRTISTDCLYTSIESTNWLLDRNIATVGTLQKRRSGIPSELFDTQNREIFSATCHFERRRRTFAWHLTLLKQSQKEKKMFFGYRPPDHCMAKQLMMVKKSPK